MTQRKTHCDVNPVINYCSVKQLHAHTIVFDLCTWLLLIKQEHGLHNFKTTQSKLENDPSSTRARGRYRGSRK